jgi:hypothetical protein
MISLKIKIKKNYLIIHKIFFLETCNYNYQQKKKLFFSTKIKNKYNLEKLINLYYYSMYKLINRYTILIIINTFGLQKLLYKKKKKQKNILFIFQK